jgi:antitoxin (DNA-binding transcriptional repressor) of toxin-antitoxin stability system
LLLGFKLIRTRSSACHVEKNADFDYSALMTMIFITDAEKELAALIARARQGEEIVITDGTEPGVKLAPVEPAKPSYRGRGFGTFKGQFDVPDSALFDPLPDDELALWNGDGEDPLLK